MLLTWCIGGLLERACHFEGVSTNNRYPSLLLAYSACRTYMLIKEGLLYAKGSLAAATCSQACKVHTCEDWWLLSDVL